MQRLANAMRNPALYLTGDNHRIDDRTEIVDRRVIDDFDGAGIRVDLDLADMRAGRKREIQRIVDCRFVQARFQPFGIVVRNIGCKGDLADVHCLVRARDREVAVGKFDVIFGRFKDMGGNLAAFLNDLVRCLDQCRTADRGRTRTVGAHTEHHLVGIAVDDIDILERDAEPLRYDLCKGRLVPLTVAV